MNKSLAGKYLKEIIRIVKKEKKNLPFITSNVRSFLPFSHILFCSVRMRMYVHVYSVGQGHRAAQLFSLILMWL